MVLTQGVVAPHLVAEAVGRRIEEEVTAISVRAWKPDLGSYGDTLQV